MINRNQNLLTEKCESFELCWEKLSIILFRLQIYLFTIMTRLWHFALLDTLLSAYITRLTIVSFEIDYSENILKFQRASSTF